MTKSELIQSLLSGDSYQFTASISKYKDWYDSLKYSDIRVTVHPDPQNRNEQCRMYSGKLILGYPHLEDILKYINKNKIKKITKHDNE